MTKTRTEPEHARSTPQQTTILQSLTRAAQSYTNLPAFTITESAEQRRTLTYGELYSKSLGVASSLRARGLQQGDRVLICLPTSVDFLASLYGVLMAGGVCVPIYPPLAAHGLSRWRHRVTAVTRVAQPCGAIVSPEGRLAMSAVLEQEEGDLFTLTPTQFDQHGLEQPASPLPEDLAFIQFTSGTTQQPRGVSISHAALMANVSALVAVMELTAADISVSWLPPYHDMGLVGHIFIPVHRRVHQYMISPLQFLKHPVQWLRLIDETRATQTTAPNFAFSMCVKRIPPSERRGLDLSSLRLVLNGAELVHAESMKRFTAAYAPYGFKDSMFRPVYGLAESTLAATFSAPGGITVDHIDRHHLASAGEARPVDRGSPSAQGVVSVGRPFAGHALRLCNTDAEDCGEREVGEIMLQGPSVMKGYFNNPQATLKAFSESWLRTGDLGYIADGELYITGRKKELIIKQGRNYLPQDFEAACLDIPELRPGRAVAFGIHNSQTGTEDLVILAERDRKHERRNPLLPERVQEVVTQRTGVRPDRVEILKPGVLFKTTSGKLQRSKVKAAYEAGKPPRAPHLTIADLVADGVWSVIERTATRARRILGWQ